jgi:hypothetical protein
MMSRGRANTRDRDFADVVVLSRIHAIDAHRLRSALQRTANHRQHPITALGNTLDGHAPARQSAWTALRQRSALDALPADFSEVVDEVVRFVDPLVESNGGLGPWTPETGRWSTSTDA